jgi:hypothetical protein
VRFVARALMGGSAEEFFSRHDGGDLRARLMSNKGIGRDVIVDFLQGIPGMNSGTLAPLLPLLPGGEGCRLRNLGMCLGTTRMARKKGLRFFP